MRGRHWTTNLGVEEVLKEPKRTMLWMAGLWLLSQEKNREDRSHLHTLLKAPPSPSVPLHLGGGGRRHMQVKKQPQMQGPTGVRQRHP